jgi:hypothetical protein
MKKATFAIRLCAGVSANGNSRRGYLICGKDGPIDYVRDDGRGWGVLIPAGYNVSSEFDIEVKPSELQRIAKSFKVVD